MTCKESILSSVELLQLSPIFSFSQIQCPVHMSGLRAHDFSRGLSVLKSVAHFATESHVVAWGQDSHLSPCWWLRDMLKLGPCRSSWPMLLLNPMMTSGPELQLRAMSRFAVRVPKVGAQGSCYH